MHLDEIRFTSDEIRRYNSTPFLALSIRLLWHELCVPVRLMTHGRSRFGVLFVVWFILFVPYQVPAQPSTAPPSSLSTRPLTPESAESELRGSCDLCREPERRAASDLLPRRRHREKGMRPNKIPKGTHRSLEQRLKATLPRRPVVPTEVQEQRDSQTREPIE